MTTGWPVSGGREYRPLTNVSREAMAAFMYRLAGSPAYRVPSRSPFRDVTPTSAFYKEICWLASMGISTGWILPDSREFRPLQPVTREAMAAFMYRLADSPDHVATRSFVDVPLSSPFAREISWLSAAGISTGWVTAAGREYRPLANVSREAMAAFMYRLAASGRPLATRSTVISAWLPYWTPTGSLTSARGCIVTVMPRTSETFAVWHGKLIPAVYDDAALSRAADRLRIMTYDQHTPATAPGPIGGYDWTEQILAYIAGRVANMAKVQLGIPAYGRRWGGGASTVAQRDAVALAAAHAAVIRVDPASRESFFSYDGGRVVVWFP